MAFCAPGVSWLAGSFAGMPVSAAPAFAVPCCAAVIFFWAAGMALAAGRGASHAGGAGDEAGQVLLGGGEPAAGGGQLRAGGLAGGVWNEVAVVFELGVVAREPVDAVVVFEVFEEVLDPPPAAEPGQQRRGGRGGVAGEHLQDGGAVLEKGDLPALAVILERDRFIREMEDLGGVAVAPGCPAAARRRGGRGERAAPPPGELVKRMRGLAEEIAKDADMPLVPMTKIFLHRGSDCESTRVV